MQQIPLVSIVIPSFNHVTYIEGCLDSVAAQNYPNLELVVNDDASSDGTAEQIQSVLRRPEFVHRFVKVHFARNEANEGAYVTINRGLSLTTGEWIGIINSDDRYVPDRIAVLLNAASSSRAQMAFSGVRFIDTSGRDVTEEDWLSNYLSHKQRRIGSFPSVGFAALCSNVAISTGNFFFHRRLLERIGGFRALLHCHDWDFLLRAVLVTEPVFVPALLYEYRLHESNTFRSLRVGDQETSFVLRAYFEAVQSGEYENPLAPGPATWPGVFERTLSLANFEQYWEYARGVKTAADFGGLAEIRSARVP